MFDYEEVRRPRATQERAERLRLYYVAMTRAIDRLIVSGAIDPGARRRPRDADRLGARPARRHDAVVDAGDAPIELERGDARFVLTRQSLSSQRPRTERARGRGAEAADDELQLALFDEIPAGPAAARHRAPALAEIPRRVHDVRRLSYSALALFERCSYRYFAERVLGLPPRDASRAGRRRGAGALAATELGDAVHRLLEHVPLDEPVPPAREELDAHGPRLVPGRDAMRSSTASPTLVDAYCESRSRAGSPRCRALGPSGRSPSSTTACVIHGRLDVLWRDGEHALVVDYKSNALEGATPAEIVEAEYRLQRLVYALACLRAGATEVEVAYQFLEQPDDVVVDDVHGRGRRRARGGALGGDRAHSRRRLPPDAERVRCADCPALDLVCAGPRLAARAVASRPCASRRSATSTGTSRRSRPCSPTSTREDVDAIVVGGDTLQRARVRPRSSSCSRDAGCASLVRGNADRLAVIASAPSTRGLAAGTSSGSARRGSRWSRCVAADARARDRRARGRALLSRDAVVRRADLHADHARRRGRRAARGRSTPTSSSAATRTCSSTGGSRAGCGSSTPGASACPTRVGRGVLGAPRPGRRAPPHRVRRRRGRRLRSASYGDRCDEEQLAQLARAARRPDETTASSRLGARGA